MSNSLLKPILIGTAAGMLIGFLLIYLSASAFADSGSTTLAQMVFPYALAFDPTVLDSHWGVLALALLQFPVYGILLAAMWPRTRRRAIGFLICTVVVLGAHFMAVREAHSAYVAWREIFEKGNSLHLSTQPNKSLDASGGGVFRIMTGPAMLD